MNKLSEQQKLIRSLRNKLEFAKANFERARVALDEATRKLNEAMLADPVRVNP